MQLQWSALTTGAYCWRALQTQIPQVLGEHSQALVAMSAKAEW